MNPPPELERARRLIDEQFDQALQLDDIARHVHLSRFHLIRRFRRAYYETPHQYLTRKRVEKAKDLLANTMLSITEICFAVGFESLGSFSALFHKIVGWSPLIYRSRVLAQRHNPYKFIPACMCFMHGLPVDEQVCNFQEA